MANVTHAAVQDGNWSDPATWNGGVVPVEGANAHIPVDVTVTVDGVFAAELNTLRVDGTLAFAADVDTELRVDTIVGAPGSVVQIGTAEQPVAADVTATIVFADNGPIDIANDPHQLGRGAVLHGAVEIHGAEKTSWTTLTDGARAGDVQLIFSEAPAGWQVGDALVMASTDGIDQDEDVRVTAIDGATVSIDRALDHDHVSPRDDLQVHVANLTRNVTFMSENAELMHRGHVMFMHTRAVNVNYAGFNQLGRTNKLEIADDPEFNEGELIEGTGENVRGRYSVHFHRNGVVNDGNPATVTGSAVVDSPGWGYVNHASYVDMIDNVSYDVDGAAFNTEAGDEIGSFINNLSIRTHGTGESPVDRQFAQDFGHAGDGFWLQGPGVTVEGNVASGATGSGIILYADGLVQEGLGKTRFLAANLDDPSLANGAETVPVVWAPIKSINHNVTYGSVVGTQFYYHRTPVQLEPDELRQVRDLGITFPQSVIEDMTMWNNDEGLRINYTLDTIFRNITIINAEDQLGDVGFNGDNVYNRGEHLYQNFHIEGFEVGMIPSRNGLLTEDGGFFDNEEVDFDIQEPRQSNRRLEFTGDIQFGNPGAVHFDMTADLRVIVDGVEDWFFLSDRVLLNFGEHAGKQLYYEAQAADFLLFPEQPEQASPDDPGFDVDEQFLEKTNQQLLDEFGMSFGGALLPDDAVGAPPNIIGLLGSPEVGDDPLSDNGLFDEDLDDELSDGDSDGDDSEGDSDGGSEGDDDEGESDGGSEGDDDEEDSEGDGDEEDSQGDSDGDGEVDFDPLEMDFAMREAALVGDKLAELAGAELTDEQGDRLLAAWVGNFGEDDVDAVIYDVAHELLAAATGEEPTDQQVDAFLEHA